MESPFDGMIEQGLAASRDNDAEAALAWFAKAGDCKPASGLPFFLIGAEHAQAGRVQQAEQAFANAVLMAPEMSIARYQLGLLQFASDRLPLALVTWQPLLALAESDPLRHFACGFVAMQRNELALAARHFEQGMALNRDNPPMNRDIALVLQQMAAAGPGPDPLHDDGLGMAQRHVLLANYQPDGTVH